MDTGNGDRVTMINTTLRNVIIFAYEIRDFQLLGGPGWVGTERYDIAARSASEEMNAATASGEDRGDEFKRLREKMRTLLADRFGLAVRREKRPEQIFLLTVGKSGPKMKAAEPTDKLHSFGGRGHAQGTAATIDMLAYALSNATGRPVVDKTGLTGRYDYSLDWSPGTGVSTAESPAANAGPTIFTALHEQLGLKLKAANTPMDVIVIDHIDRPSGN